MEGRLRKYGEGQGTLLCSAVLWVSQDVWPERSGLCVSLLREKEFVIHAMLKRKSAGLFCLNTPQ